MWQYRGADDRLVQEAGREGRRLQGPEDAHSRARGPRLPVAGRRRAATAGRRDLPGARTRRDDAAEFVGPFQDRRLGLHRAAKYYYTTGWHETATSKRADHQPRQMGIPAADLKAIIENAFAACNVISEARCQANNAEAIEDLVKYHGVIARPLSDDDGQDAARSEHRDLRRGGQKGPADQESPTTRTRPIRRIHAMVELQRGDLPRQDPRRVDVAPAEAWPTGGHRHAYRRDRPDYCLVVIRARRA